MRSFILSLLAFALLGRLCLAADPLVPFVSMLVVQDDAPITELFLPTAAPTAGEEFGNWADPTTPGGHVPAKVTTIMPDLGFFTDTLGNQLAPSQLNVLFVFLQGKVAFGDIQGALNFVTCAVTDAETGKQFLFPITNTTVLAGGATVDVSSWECIVSNVL